MAMHTPESTSMDDVGVKEIDVYISNSLAENLCILQYPTRPKHSAANSQDVLSAKVKPNQQKVELQYRLDVRSSNYDRSKGEQIALNVDGNKIASESYFDSSRMDKHTYTSTKVVSCGSRYAVGVIRKGELHITLVKAFLQMRPSFSYLDKCDTHGQGENTEEPAEEEELVTVKFAGPSSEKAKKIREKSYQYLQQQLENEPWCPAIYNRYGSAISKSIKSQLFCKDVGNNSSDVFLASDSFVKVVVSEKLLHSRKVYGNSNVLDSLSILKSRSPLEQIREMMINAKVLTFKQICELLPPEYSETAEKFVQQVAYLVQGCWVVRSDVLYGTGNSSQSGLANEILLRARDYIVWNFTKSRYIRRSDILSVIKVPKEDVDDILSQISKKVYNKGWEFRYPYDEEFDKCYPIIMQRQKMLWEMRYKQLARDSRLGQVGELSPKKSFPPPPRPKERRQLKYRESVSDDTEESSAESTSNDKMEVDQPPNRRGKSMKRNFITRKRSFSSSGKSPTKLRQQPLTPSEISPTFLSVLPSVEIKSELLNHVREVLFDQYCITIAELKDSLSEVGLDYIAQREDCDVVLEETLLQAGAQRLRNKWPQNTQPVPLFAFTKFGASFDQYRDALLDLFTNTARSRPSFLVKKIEDERGEIISEAVCKQIFEEYCTYKSGYYYLKGTISPDQ